MGVGLIGKEADKKMAEKFRESFVEQYKDNANFEQLMEGLGEDCIERLIHRLKIEEKINLFKDYIELKKIAKSVFEESRREVYRVACKEDNARAWINDNGKYSIIVFDALYKVFKQKESLKEYIVIK